MRTKSWCHLHDVWECVYIENKGNPDPSLPRICCHNPVDAAPDGTSKSPYCDEHKKEKMDGRTV